MNAGEFPGQPDDNATSWGGGGGGVGVGGMSSDNLSHLIHAIETDVKHRPDKPLGL